MQAVHERWRPPDIRFVVVIGQKVGAIWIILSMRGVKLILVIALRIILEGEEEVFLVLFRKFDHEK